MNEYELEKLFEKENLYKHDIVLFITSGGFAYEQNNSLAAAIAKPRKKGIHLTANVAAETLARQLGKNTANKMVFVDSVSRKQKADQIKNAVYLRTESLVEVSTIINGLLDSGKYEFLFSCSVHALLEDKEPGESEEFLHYLTEKLRNHKVFGGFSTREGIDPVFTELLSKKADKVVTIFG